MDTETTRQDRTTDIICFAGLNSGVAITLIAAYLMPCDGRFWVYATVATRLLLYFGASRTTRGKLFGELLTMGVIAGFVELLADYFLIHWVETGRLVYPPADALLLDSPPWMPLAWTCVVTELGYVTLRLARLGRRPWIGALAGALIAGVMIGFFEYFAYLAGWWEYAPARWMIGEHCALYIPVGEVLMFAAFYPLFTRTEAIGDAPLRAIVRGAAFGATIFAAYAIAYAVMEGW